MKATYSASPYLKSMVTCLTKVVDDGYREDFRATGKGLQSVSSKKFYAPAEVKVVNFFRFEGFRDPNDNAILYVIETNDGLKGTLIDAYGMYADPLVSQFIMAVKTGNKNIVRH